MLSTISHANAISYNYVTSVKVNQIELNAAVSADQVNKLIKNGMTKTHKVYSECTGNYEYSLNPSPHKTLKFEIFTEDNPQIKDGQFYQDKSSFKQLGQTKGRIWMTWNNTKDMSENIVVQNIHISAQYSLQQFKQDFKHSARSINPSGEAQVLILENNQAKAYLNHPHEFSPPYTAYLNFQFKNGKLAQFAIQQALGC
ncbi:hypothetical protein [Acinetobacter sp. ANC 4173]|uniref:hypothetical protein n=1 Tax=Acinetobacter sp. ANC 4173 TaxID=2529837 RepID=UPI001D0D9FD3|nr:hypothetical protein [Acinetobacter sp. ANC 4173]